MDLNGWAARRDGLISAGAARRAGISERQVAHRVATKRYVRVRRGVVAVGGAPRTWRQVVRAVLLACPDVAASHETSARLLGVDADADLIHVIGDLSRQVTMEGVVSHRSGVLEPGDIVVRQGMRCTSPLRTVIDLSGSMTAARLGEVVDEFLRRRMLRLDDLRRRVAVTRPAPGRSVATLRRVLADRIPGYDPGESPLEARIARIIDRLGLERPTQQFRVTYGKARYRVDFAWPSRKLYLEGNSFGFHALSSDLDSDARRQNSFVLDGWRPITITWRMTDDEIAATLLAFLGAS
jgi:hypothetical protein